MKDPHPPTGEKRIRRALVQVPGVVSADVSSSDGIASAVFNSSIVESSALLEALQQEGFQAKVREVLVEERGGRFRGFRGAEPRGQFCDGYGTVMYMSGFQSVFDPRRSEQPCVAFLLESLVLDTPFKFAAGCIAAISLGIAMEAALMMQRLQSTKAMGMTWLLFWYGVSVFIGYLLMLIAMVYSIELLLAVILGLVLGKALLPGALLAGPPCHEQREAGNCSGRSLEPPRYGAAS